MTMRLADLSQNAAADGVVDRLDGGYIEMRTGTQPADPDDSATGTLVVTINLSTPAFGDTAAGVATMNATTGPGTAVADGTVEYARFYTSGGAAVFDCAIGTSGSDINLNKVAILTDETVDITTFTYTQPRP